MTSSDQTNVKTVVTRFERFVSIVSFTEMKAFGVKISAKIGVVLVLL